MKISQARRAELRFDAENYPDISPIGLEAKELNALIDMADECDEILEALEEAHQALLSLDGEYAGSSVCQRNQSVIDKARGRIR